MDGVGLGLLGVHDARTLGVAETGLGCQGQGLVRLLLLQSTAELVARSGVPHSTSDGQGNLGEVHLGSCRRNWF